MKKFVLLVAAIAFFLSSFDFNGTAFGAISSDEVGLLQKLSQQLEESAKSEVDKVQQLSHGGRYNEDTLLTQLSSFSEASKTLNSKLAEATTEAAPKEAEVVPTINELKTLVLSIDDIFVYESGYDHVRRDWNECKRILRRIDGIVSREGFLRRIEKIIDSNQFFREVGYFFETHGALSKLEDKMHGDKFFKPVNDVVGRHGGGRNTTGVWQIPQPQHQAQTTQNRSSFNEDLTEF